MKINVDFLNHELMRMVVGLDQDNHPAAKLKAIKAPYGVNGTLESNNTRRLSPPDNEESPGIYRSLFDRLRSSYGAHFRNTAISAAIAAAD